MGNEWRRFRHVRSQLGAAIPEYAVLLSGLALASLTAVSIMIESTDATMQAQVGCVETGEDCEGTTGAPPTTGSVSSTTAPSSSTTAPPAPPAPPPPAGPATTTTAPPAPPPPPPPAPTTTTTTLGTTTTTLPRIHAAITNTAWRVEGSDWCQYEGIPSTDWCGRVRVTFTDADTNEPISWGGSATLSVTNSPSASASCADGGDSNNNCGTLVHSGASSVTFTITGVSKAGYTWDGEVDSATIST